MAMNLAAFGDNLDPTFRTIYHDTEKDYPTVGERIFNVSSTKLYQVKESANTGFGLVPGKTEGQATVTDRRYQGYDKTYTQAFYGVGAEVTREMATYDTTRSMANIPRAMARSKAHTIETILANHFNRHITSGYTGADGSLLCVTDHPSRQGSSATHSNLGTAGSLTHTTLSDGRLAMVKTLDPRQLHQRLDPKILLIPPDLAEKAFVLTGSKEKSGTANNDLNWHYNAGFTPVVWNFITITTAYWLLTDKKDHQLNLIWSAKPEFNRDKGVSEQVLKWYLYMAFVSGWTDWRGVWGNNGA